MNLFKMILSITKDGRTLQAYKEIGITRNVIIEIVELVIYHNPLGYDVTSHRYVCQRGTDLNYNTTLENDIQLVKLAEERINEQWKNL